MYHEPRDDKGISEVHDIRSITQKPASILPENDETVLLSPNKFQISIHYT